MSNSVRPQRRQPIRLHRPWDSPGKNTGVGCHFLLQWMKMKSESEVAQSCPTLSDPMDCSLSGSSVHGIFRQEYWSSLHFSKSLNLWKYFILEEKQRQLWNISVLFFFSFESTDSETQFPINICDILPILGKFCKIKDTNSHKISQYFPHFLLIKPILYGFRWDFIA